MDFAISKLYQGRLVYADKCDWILSTELNQGSDYIRVTLGLCCFICGKAVVFRQSHGSSRLTSASGVSACFVYSKCENKPKCKLDLQKYSTQTIRDEYKENTKSLIKRVLNDLTKTFNDNHESRLHADRYPILLMRARGLIQLKQVPLYKNEIKSFIKYFQEIPIHPETRVCSMLYEIFNELSHNLKKRSSNIYECSLDIEFQEDCTREAISFLKERDNEELLEKFLLHLGEVVWLQKNMQEYLYNSNDFILSNLLQELSKDYYIRYCKDK